MSTRDENTRRAVFAVLTEVGGDRPAVNRLAGDTPLTDGGLGLTSAEFIRVLIELEEACDVDLDDAVQSSAGLRTVDDLVLMAQHAGTGEPEKLS